MYRFDTLASEIMTLTGLDGADGMAGPRLVFRWVRYLNAHFGHSGAFGCRPTGESPGLLQVHDFLADGRQPCVSPSLLSCCLLHERTARFPLHAYLLTHRHKRLAVP